MLAHMRTLIAVSLIFLSWPMAAAEQKMPGALLAVEPGPLSESCGAARTSTRPIIAELEATIPEQFRAEARQHLAAESTLAQAWSDFAAAVLLIGDVELAAWAGLQAAGIDWDSELVGNAGTYLLHAGRVEARTWLLCARNMGPRSAFVLEALAVAYERAGDAAGAREAIGQARRLDPEDPIMEIEHSFLTTDGPPAPAPRQDEAAERCQADLERHAEGVYARVKAQQNLLDRLTGLDSRAQAFTGAWETIYEPLLASMRGLIQMAPTVTLPKSLWHNQTLVQCITYYFSFTEMLLDSVVRDSGTTLTFWAQAMRLDPAMFVRDTTDPDEANPVVFSAHRLPSTTADRALYDLNDGASKQYRRDIDGCNAIRDMSASNACRREAERRECATNVRDFEEWDARQSRNYNTAAQNFDRVALDLLRWTESEVENAHSFAARYALEFQADGPVMLGPDGRSMAPKEFALYQVNLSYRMLLLEPYLTTGSDGVDDFIAEQAQWFDYQKQWFEDSVELGRQDLAARCNPILLREQLEALAQEQWEAYRQELWDRMTANVEAEWDPTINCEGKVDGFTISIDDSGFDSLSAKWKNFSASLDSSGKLKLKGSWKFKGGSINTQTTIRHGEVVGVSVGASGSVPVAPGVSAKGGVTVVSDGSRNEPAIAFSGSLELGIKRGGAGVSCTPGSGSLKVHPRAFTQAAVTYALAGGR